jgi:hypothetical protein
MLRPLVKIPCFSSPRKRHVSVLPQAYQTLLLMDSKPPISTVNSSNFPRYIIQHTTLHRTSVKALRATLTGSICLSTFLLFLFVSPIAHPHPLQGTSSLISKTSTEGASSLEAKCADPEANPKPVLITDLLCLVLLQNCHSIYLNFCKHFSATNSAVITGEITIFMALKVHDRNNISAKHQTDCTSLQSQFMTGITSVLNIRPKVYQINHKPGSVSDPQ